MWQTNTWSLTGTGQAFSTQGLIQLGGHIRIYGLRRLKEVLPCSTLFLIVTRTHIDCVVLKYCHVLLYILIQLLGGGI